MSSEYILSLDGNSNQLYLIGGNTRLLIGTNGKVKLDFVNNQLFLIGENGKLLIGTNGKVKLDYDNNNNKQLFLIGENGKILIGTNGNITYAFNKNNNTINLIYTYTTYFFFTSTYTISTLDVNTFLTPTFISGLSQNSGTTNTSSITDTNSKYSNVALGTSIMSVITLGVAISTIR